MRKIFLIVSLFFIGVFSFSQEKLKIGVTLQPYYSFVKNIVKDKAEVVPSVRLDLYDSHSYQPQADDIKNMENLDVLVVNGIGHDEFIFKILNATSRKDKIKVIYSNENVALMPVSGTLSSQKILNPHTFISITAAIQQVYTIAKKLGEIDVENKNFYIKNAKEYAKRLRKLKIEALKSVENLGDIDFRVATLHGGYDYLLSEFGIEVKAVVELMPFSGGLARNIAQCLNDYDIPLYLSHTVIDIQGKDRLEKVTIAKVDENRKPIPGTEKEYEVDTLLLSVGLIPENDISRATGVDIDGRTSGAIVNEVMETNIEGIFACGNVLHVHDLVDFVSAEARKAGLAASKYIKGQITDGDYIELKNGFGIGYTVPQKVRINNIDKGLEVFMRVRNIYKNMTLQVRDGENVILSLRKPHVAPGEMEKIMIPKSKLELIKGKEIVPEIGICMPLVARKRRGWGRGSIRGIKV